MKKATPPGRLPPGVESKEAKAKREREALIMWILVGVGSLCSLWVIFYVIWKAMGR